MPKLLWDINLDGELHHVEIDHALWFGPCMVRVDGKIAAGGTGLRATGLSYAFTIGGHSCEALAVSFAFRRTYVIAIDGTPYIAAGEDPHARPIRAVTKEVDYFCGLARLLGIRHHVLSRDKGVWRRRLVGSVDGYLVAIGYGVTRTYKTSVVWVSVRHRAAPGPEAQWSWINKDPDWRALFGKKIDERVAESDTALTAWFGYDLEDLPPARMARDIGHLVHLIAKFAGPPLFDRCEGPDCADPLSGSLCVALVNDVPVVMHDACARAESIRRRRNAATAARKAPSFLRGAVMGALAAALGVVILTVAWAASALLAALLSLGLSWLILLAMNRAWGRPKPVGVPLVLIYTLAGVIAAAFLHGADEFVRSASTSSSVALYDMLTAAGKMTWKNLAQVFGWAAWSVALACYAGLDWWLRFRRLMKDVLHPVIDVIRPWPWPTDAGRPPPLR